MDKQHRPPLSGWRRGVSLMGELLITVGILALLLVAYDLWWTNVVAQRVASQERTELQQQWGDPDPVPGRDPGPPPTVTPTAGDAFGLVYIPRLRDEVWGLPVISGVSDGDLARGIGHVPESSLPGEVGNFVIAGHRATNGQPLAFIDRVEPGDEVIIETEFGWYVYRLQRDEIVAPTAVWVMDPVPGEPRDTEATEEIITVITCNPRWASYERWIWWGELRQVLTKPDGPPAAIVAGQEA